MFLHFISLLRKHSSCGSKIFGALGVFTLMKSCRQILKTLDDSWSCHTYVYSCWTNITFVTTSITCSPIFECLNLQPLQCSSYSCLDMIIALFMNCTKAEECKEQMTFLLIQDFIASSRDNQQKQRPFLYDNFIYCFYWKWKHKLPFSSKAVVGKRIRWGLCYKDQVKASL